MLKELLEERGISVYKLSKETGIAYSTINDIVIDKTDIKNVSSNMLYRLSKYLEMSMEQLYENSYEAVVSIYLYNKGRGIVLRFNNERVQYLGPKNLVGFHRINVVKGGVIYVDCYYRGDDNVIYSEEDYIDLNDVLSNYQHIINGRYRIVLGEPNSSTRQRIINEALLVSDNIAILNYKDENIPGRLVQVVSVARPKSKSIIRVDDLSVVYSNMSENMLQRSLKALSRNMEEIKLEVDEVNKYA